MSRSLGAISSIFVVGTFLVVSRAALLEPEIDPARGFQLSAEEQETLERANTERNRAKVSVLAANVKLFKAARDHSANMAKQEKLSHTLDDRGPAERLDAVRYAHLGWAENCAAGQRSPDATISTWMESPQHRANLLDKRFNEVGIGIATADDGAKYWTLLLAKPARPRAPNEAVRR